MATRVDRWICDDGMMYKTEADAMRHDIVIAQCREVESRVLKGARPDSCDFTNGVLGYIQHASGTRDTLFDDLKKLGATRDSDGAVGRLLSRAYCLDEQDREWGQPYYANNPQHASGQNMLEDRR